MRARAALVSCLLAVLAVLAVRAEALAQWGIGGLNIQCDLKAQIEALVLSGSIEPLPLSSHQKDWQGASEPKPTPDLDDIPEPAEPNEPEPTPAAPVEGDGVLKQKVTSAAQHSTVQQEFIEPSPHQLVLFAQRAIVCRWHCCFRSSCLL